MTDEHRLLANTTFRVLAEVLSKVISIAFYVVLAREVGDGGFGVFTFALAFVTLVTTLSNFGQDAIFIREVAPRRDRINGFFANTLALKGGLGLAALAVALAAATIAEMDGEVRLVLLLLGLAVITENLMWTFFAAFQSFDRLGYIPIVLVWQRLVTTAVGIPVVLLGGGVVAASAVYLCGAVSALIVASAFLFRRVVRPRVELDVQAWWPLIRAAFPVGLGSVFSTTLFRIDAAILAIFATDAVVGDYGAAYRLFEATLFLSWSVGTAVYPVFARLGATTEAALSDVYERGLKLVVLPTLPLAVGALVLGTSVITLVYGGEFEEGGTALMLLAPAIALYPVEHVAAGMLIAQRRQNAVAAVLGLVAALNVVGNILLIPIFSLNAAAFNTSLSELLLTVSFLVLARRLTGAIDWRRVAGGPVLASVLAAVTMFVLRDWVAIAIAGGAIVYVVAVVIWERKVFPEDAAAVSDLLLRRSRPGPPAA